MSLSAKTKEIIIVALANKKAGEELAAAVDAQAENVAEIADPSAATAEDAANKVNEVIQALIAAGAMKAE
jgi:hypothetical protein